MTPTMRHILLNNDPKYIAIRHKAGTFNFGITNGTDVRWVFPDGAVSTAAQPNVSVPAGITKLYASNLSASGVQLTDGNSNAIVLSKLKDFRKLTYHLNLNNCPLVTGSLADLQGKLTYLLDLYGCSLVTGSLADLQGKLTNHLSLINCTLITGSLADLQGKLTNTLDLAYCSLITGSLADLQGKLTYYLVLSGCSLITGVYTPVGPGTPGIINLSNTGLSTADMDNTLIAIAGAGTPKSNGTFTATGMTRSAASDAAISTLSGRGWIISGLTKV